MVELFGVEVDQPSFSMWSRGGGTLGEGYLKPARKSHYLMSHLQIPLHFFNGVPARATKATEIAGVLDAIKTDESRRGE